MRNSRNLFARTLILVLLINVLTVPPSYAGPRRELVRLFMAGRVTTAVPNTILSGTSAPRSSIGIEGDFYIDVKALDLYGPKGKSSWPNPISLRGPQGVAGAKGVNGTNGVDGKNSSSAGSTGPQGIAGPIGPRGEVGITGAIGPAGPTGAAGPMGPAGAPGATGAAGLAGAAGTQGSPGANGAPGSAGATGGIGLTGATGAAGATGPSNAYQGGITFAGNIQGVSGTSQVSDAFGTLAAGKSYIFRVRIQSYNAAQLLLTYPLALTVSAQGASPTISYSYSVANGSLWISAAKREEVTIFADISIDGSAVVSSYSLTVTITCGTNTTSFPVALAGNFVGILVGQIS